MTISIDIIPLTDSIDMYGEPDASSAYSLSGHVSISLRSSSSFFERRRAVRILLQSLVITFEGQSELVTPEIGYSAIRLCSLKQEVAPNEAIELNNEGHEDSDKPCTWNVVFNIPLPGWLPATDVFGDSELAPPGTRYALYATAKFQHVEEPSQSSSWLSTLCSPFLSRTKLARAPRCEIAVNRYTIPPAMPSSELSIYPFLSYSVAAIPLESTERDINSIPIDVLSKIQVLASTPEHIGMEQGSFPFTLRLRAPGLSEEDTGKLQIIRFSVELEQLEKYRASRSSAYCNRFPVPRETLQPPHKPLRSPHPLDALADLGLLVSPNPRHSSVSRGFSLLAESAPTVYCLPDDGHIFRREIGVDSNAWYTLQTAVPFARERANSTSKARWAGACALRSTSQSPFLDVSHNLEFTVTCKYDTGVEGEEALVENLQFSLLLDFVRERPAMLSQLSDPQSRAFPDSVPSPSSTKPVPYTTSSLPAYSELFYANGDRKIDESTPLPLYTRSNLPPPSCSSTTLDRPAVSRTGEKQTQDYARSEDLDTQIDVAS
ncbi:hypothetical protein EW146_g3642 [Bondarzewia mesenterica]|uniref:Arrestin-like N-terminal domain-containing protein n=1 Tax=Bondarzewia mesenterica TaxID=1095465 RepID=A0A4S4LYV2_9AGAM|nr:hypothetical protein EW146_g3642 [Bondarzewia mesenterica]